MGRDHRDMNRSADKKTAFVTGASYGVGAATALALARDGFDVAVSATRAENLDATTAQLAATGVRVVALVLDLGSQSSIERAMAGMSLRHSATSTCSSTMPAATCASSRSM